MPKRRPARCTLIICAAMPQHAPAPDDAPRAQRNVRRVGAPHLDAGSVIRGGGMAAQMSEDFEGSARDLARGRASARAEAARLPAGRPDSRPLRAKFSRKHLDLPRTQLDAGARHDQERCLRPRLVPVSAKVVLQVSYSV